MEGYSVKVIDASRQLTAKEKIAFKDFGLAAQLDDVVTETGLIINVKDYVVLQVHNEKSDNKDYTKFLLIDEKGEKYITGSEPFWTTFKDIWDEISDEPDVEWSLKVYKLESKNYKGKQFLTCSII
nr:MAG TPA: ssDNA binding protein [Caudoviricetes sp.]